MFVLPETVQGKAVRDVVSSEFLSESNFSVNRDALNDGVPVEEIKNPAEITAGALSGAVLHVLEEAKKKRVALEKLSANAIDEVFTRERFFTDSLAPFITTFSPSQSGSPGTGGQVSPSITSTSNVQNSKVISLDSLTLSLSESGVSLKASGPAGAAQLSAKLSSMGVDTSNVSLPQSVSVSTGLNLSVSK